ncbi:putative outer membrane starch-binding protein [Gramella sp. Hel_I_59]|uniref:RagB/SusD family nutrient uptake outer membrane protein n=1 Tax=Gramella sp. Hel_I_59 TaxID=1249978 RepID=UPI00114ECD23|nr:RagB/SusD family nutrient uptake outer membrane protein [Gramella sp. Hel_I_59]TQI69753.1 putative outer membrane starch-binding protein [Gramella sp. Hel_I_59]
MKRIKVLLGAFVGLILFSCSDAIEIDQPGRLDADAAFETVDDLESGLFGVYNNINLAPEIAFNAIFTDELAIGFDNGGQGIQDYGFNLNAGSAASANFWIRNYGLINSANRLIDAALALEPAASEESRYNDILGQAYAIRAFGHFQLQSYYTTDYTDDSALGVILVDFVPTIDQQLLRNTNGEVFGLIESDLDQAESLLNTESSATFISQDFVTAMRARMAAYRQNYAVAEANASELLDKYGLADKDEYQGIFNDSDNAEIIFKLERTIGDSYDVQGPTGTVATAGWIGARFAFVGPGYDGSPYFEAGRSLFNLVDEEDVRFEVLFDSTSVIDPNYAAMAGGQTNDVLVVNKYAGSEGRPLMNDLKVFRSSEMLLILAEAYAAQGNFNGDSNSTASLIKRLRDARYGTDTILPSYDDMQGAFADILEERRVELAFEGHRWKDLKRLGERANRGVLKDPVDCAFNGACTLSPTDYRFTLPLPIVEFQANPGLRDQQNPGY